MSDTPYSLPMPEFRQKRQGYHPDEVDEWIDGAFALVEQVNREMSSLRDQLYQAQQAAQSAAASGGGAQQQSSTSNELDETLRRTLVLAQKTADAAIAEAKEEATRISNEARNESERVINDANESARRLAQDAQQHVRADVLKLEAARTELQNDVNKLRAYLDEERDRIRETLSNALSLLDKGVDEGRPIPPISEVQIPAETSFGRFGSGAPANTGEVAADEDDADDDFGTNDTNSGYGSYGSSFDQPTQAVSSDWANTSATESPYESPNPYESALDEDDEQYMAELRRAVTDPSPLGPREDEDPYAAPTEYTDLTGPVPTTSTEPETSDFTSEDFFSPDDDEDPGFGGRLRRRR